MEEPQLHINQEHSDAPLLEHVRELLTKLDGMGINSSLEHEDQWEGWEDVDSDDSDVNMATAP